MQARLVDLVLFFESSLKEVLKWSIESYDFCHVDHSFAFFVFYDEDFNKQ